jgi:methanogenic corrinoid protein MtbC1
MLQTLLTLAGAHCISLGASIPATELVKAAISHNVKVVALSFSLSFPNRRIIPLLEKIRQLLPDNIELWAGGAGIDNLRRKVKHARTFDNLALTAKAISELKK